MYVSTDITMDFNTKITGRQAPKLKKGTVPGFKGRVVTLPLGFHCYEAR